MAGEYFEIKDDVERPGRWFLRGPQAPDGARVDPTLFTRGTIVEAPANLFIPQRQRGYPVDFTFADCEMPVVVRWIADAILAAAPNDVQIIPAKVEGHTHLRYIVNVLAMVDCFDRDQSQFDVWTEADNFPKKVGQIFGVSKLRIKKERIANKHVFRIEGWNIPIVVSEELKCSLEKRATSGVLFAKV